MKTIKTKPDCTLGFVGCPANVENKWVKNLRIKGSIYIEGFDFGNPTELEGKLVIGKLSEITEEQAMELVSLGIMDLTLTNPEDQREMKVKVNLDEKYTMDKWQADIEGPLFKSEAYKLALHSAALSVGIEEKDFGKYLVIKL